MFEASNGRDQVADRLGTKVGRVYLINRALSNAVLAILVLILPFEVSDAGRLIAAGAILCNVPLTMLVERLFPNRLSDVVGNLTAIVTTTGIALGIPAIWHPGFLVVAALIVSSIATHSRRVIAAQLIPAATSFAVVGAITSVAGWYLSIFALLVITVAIDAYHRQWRALRAVTDARYDAMVDAAGLFFWEIDIETGVVVSITGDTQALLGRAPSDIVGGDWRDLVPEHEIIDGKTIESTTTTDQDSVLHTELIHVDGRRLAFRHLMRTSSDGLILQGAAAEISELAAASRTIRHQAEHDSLTGLGNRALLMTTLERALERRRDDEQLALLFLDLDRFKEVNDTLGHDYGDRLLAVLAERLDNSIDVDLVARLGGDEFAFVAAATDEATALELATAIAELVDERVQLAGVSISVSASIGVAIAPDDGTTPEELMKNADIAMYAAKKRGAAVRRFETAPHELSMERLRLASELSDALQSGQFKLWFQPKVDLARNAIGGAEGLARWEHPTMGTLKPDRFLGLMMVSGHYQAFTDQMIEQAVTFARRCADEGSPIEVAVNLSAMSFFDEDLPERVHAALEVHGVAPERLTLEITEADFLDDPTTHRPVFRELAELGVRLAIDDFGVGYSSLSRLRRLPVTELKIDQSFVRGLLTGPEDRIIVRTILALAAVFRHHTVAEGIETEAEANALREMGCAVGQGNFFGEPMPADALVETLRQQPTAGLLAPSLPAGRTAVDTSAAPDTIGVADPIDRIITPATE